MERNRALKSARSDRSCSGETARPVEDIFGFVKEYGEAEVQLRKFVQFPDT